MSTRHALAKGTAILLSLAMTSALAHKSSHTHKTQHNASMACDMAGMHGMKMTGDQDYDFATMMRQHHQMGLDMAKKELSNGKNADMRAMAQSIVDAQSREVARLDAWLSAHHPVTSSSKSDMSGMPGMTGQSDMSGMPGMSDKSDMSGMPGMAGHAMWAPFETLDSNHDGALAPSELPSTEMLKQHFAVVDSNHDGKLSAAEVATHRAQMDASKDHN